MKFLLQTIQGENVFKIQHDFVFEMSHALKYYEWKGDHMDRLYCTLENMEGIDELRKDIKDYVPVGTIEFVTKFVDLYIKKDGMKEIKPLNVPENMFDYAGRTILNIRLGNNKEQRSEMFRVINDLIIDKRKVYYMYIKSNDTIKSPVNGCYDLIDILDMEKIPEGNYQISTHILIKSEYRCFIYKGELVGIQYYSGDFEVYPDVNRIKEMCSCLVKEDTKNLGYTLDVAVTEDDQTVVVEVHDFFSCGLYGFNDYKILPYMFYRTFQKIKKELLLKN